MDNVNELRGLTYGEQETLRRALALLEKNTTDAYADAATIMLEENMIQRFLFAERPS